FRRAVASGRVKKDEWRRGRGKRGRRRGSAGGVFPPCDAWGRMEAVRADPPARRLRMADMTHTSLRRLPRSILMILSVSSTACRTTCAHPTPDSDIRPPIFRSDTFPAADSILVAWDSGNYPPVDFDSRKPAPTVKGVRLFVSETSADRGYAL